MGNVDEAGAFEHLDGRLTVFALANGMDLRKEPGSRHLEWFSRGLERGIRLEPAGGGGLALRIRAWRFDAAARATEVAHVDGVLPEALTRSLEAAVEEANRLEVD